MSPAQSEDLPALAVGERVQLYRERAGKTRVVLGGLVGKSAEWVKAVERGRLLPPRLPMLERIASVLRVPLSDLVGDHAPQLRQLAGPAHDALPHVRTALNIHPVAGETTPDLRELAARIAAAWRARHSSPDHRTMLGELLPGLIRDSRTATAGHRGQARRIAYVLESDVLGLAQMFLAYQPAAELLWRGAERAMVTADESDDPHARAMATWFMVEALRDSGDWDSAMDINQSALRDSEHALEQAASVEVLAMVGALHTVAALTAARGGEEGLAWRHWDLADTVTRRLPADYVHPQTWFSPAVVGFYALSVAVELRKGGQAVDHARRIDAQTITSRPRRARHLVEVARAHHLRADADNALAAVTAAVAAAPSTVRYNSHARQIVLDLREDSARRTAAGQLAASIGL